MKPYVAVALLLALFSAGCATKKAADKEARSEAKNTAIAPLPEPKPGEAVATFAAGCFWCIEEEFELLKGVRDAVSGYAGGPGGQPTYEEVGSGNTGHAESVQVYYDPKVIPYDTLAKAFLMAHDPTTLNRQGPDRGTQYRSVAFYRTPAEKASLEAAIARFNASGEYKDPVVTQVVPFKAFYPAEVYHQGYYRAHPDDFYIMSVSTPKVEKFKKHLADKLKPELVDNQ
ncbi:peptide-methionine (S)-S-oxide reductase MsrA [Fibrella aquatilis]|uniref:Peptide methionine sulfoxide reductase MsrA n=1 Tax=Fibrella aquatilis TaxID=2817059 RepID=A0A939K1U9_9BACT|nr:peptide-methionine (S)-S-oxide reductase MsrA [Fibrella aquatilis]MBO0933431.1 peptide-methionine (S)-S-oxide reductase MsrA [Fibrella aquatilis]